MEYLIDILGRESFALKENRIGGNRSYVFESTNQEVGVNKLRRVCHMSAVPNISSQRKYHLKF